jgi:hypothetical protein
MNDISMDEVKQMANKKVEEHRQKLINALSEGKMPD